MDAEKVLTEEFIKRYKYTLYWPLKIMAFCRYDIENNNIIKLKFSTVLYKLLILFLANSGAVYITYSAIVNESYLKPADGICMIHFGLFANLMVIDTFINKDSGVDLMYYSIKVDAFLGVKETEFLRDVDVKAAVIHDIIVLIVNAAIGVFLYNVYEVPMKIHLAGSLYYFWLLFIYCDFGVYILKIAFLSMRARYLNVLLLKYGNVNETYLPNRSIFNKLFWKKRFNKLVKYQNLSVTNYVTALRMLFHVKELLETCYGIPYMLGTWTVVVGTFVAVQTFILRIKYSMMVEIGRTFIIVGWVTYSWAFLYIVGVLTDMFKEQLNQTKLICAYIQLKPNLPAQTYKLTKSIFRTLSTRDPKINIYNMFYLDSGFIFRMAAATLVYITVQLQMAFPELSVQDIQLNNTSNFN